MRTCIGHDRCASRGSAEVIHVDCSAEIDRRLHGNVRRCPRCAVAQRAHYSRLNSRTWARKERSRRGMPSRPCAGHERYAGAGSPVVVHVDCDARLSPLVPYRVRRCGRCQLWQRRFINLRAQRVVHERRRERHA